MAVYTVSSHTVVNGEKYNGVISLPYYLPSGVYQVLEFITTNRFPNVLNELHFERSSGGFFQIPSGFYNGTDLATAIQAAFNVNIWPVNGGTVSYNLVTNLITITYNNLADPSFRVASARMGVMMSMSTSTFQKTVISGPIDTSPMKIIYMNIRENTHIAAYDPFLAGQHLIFTPDLEGSYIIYRQATHGYMQSIQTRDTHNSISVVFRDNYGAYITQNPIDWYLLLKKVN